MNERKVGPTRRRLLVNAAFFGAAAVMGPLLSACGGPAPAATAKPDAATTSAPPKPPTATGQPPTAVSATQQPAAAAPPGAAKAAGTVTMMVQSGAQQTRAFTDFVPEFKKTTGIDMKLVEVPTGEMFAKIMVDMSGGTSSYDLLTMNNVTLVGAAQHLEDVEALGLLTPELKADLSPSSLDLAKDAKGVSRGLPDFATVIGLYYRTDLFAAKGLQPPTTWDTYREAAKKLNDPQNNIWGAVFQASSKGSNTGQKIAAWMYQAGGGLADAAGKPIINAPENIEAAKFIAGLVNDDKVAPGDVVDMTNVEAHTMFLQGRAAMLDNWQYLVSLGRDPQQSKVVDKFGVVALPKGKRAGSMIGGWFFAVPKTAKNKEGAMAFAKASLSPEEQIRMASKEGLPARLSVMDPAKYPKILEANPQLPAFRTMLAEQGFTPPKWVKLDDIYRRLTVAIQRSILRQQTPEQAMADAQKEIVDLVGQA